MNQNKVEYIYNPEIIKAILSANQVKLLIKTLKRLGMNHAGRKDELLSRLAN
jgi:hypothetical protein